MRIQIEILDFDDTCRHRTVLARKKIKDGTAIFKHPTIVLVSGKGVVTKSYDKDRTIIQRVGSNDSLYYSCDERNKELSFVRKEAVDCEIAPFSNVLYIKVYSKIDDRVVGATVSDFYSKTLTIKNLLRYGDDCKIILAHIVKKVEMPLLISVFGLLLINFFVNAHFSEMNNSLQTELIQSKKNTDNTDSQLKDMTKLITENIPDRSMDASVLVNMLAAQIPDGITVNYFAVDPLKRKVETQKTLNIEKSTILVKGETLSANAITIMTNNIENLDFSKNVKIKNIGKKQDSEMLEFEIEVTY